MQYRSRERQYTRMRCCTFCCTSCNRASAWQKKIRSSTNVHTDVFWWTWNLCQSASSHESLPRKGFSMWQCNRQSNWKSVCGGGGCSHLLVVLLLPFHNLNCARSHAFVQLLRKSFYIYFIMCHSLYSCSLYEGSTYCTLLFDVRSRWMHFTTRAMLHKEQIISVPLDLQNKCRDNEWKWMKSTAKVDCTVRQQILQAEDAIGRCEWGTTALWNVISTSLAELSSSTAHLNAPRCSCTICGSYGKQIA